MFDISLFQRVDFIFDMIFVLVTLLVTLRGFRAYRFFKDEKYWLHSMGFLFLFASYLILAITRYRIYTTDVNLENAFLKLLEIRNMQAAGFALHALFFLVGLAFLLILYIQIYDKTTRLLLTILVFFSAMLSTFIPSMFYVLIAILLLFIIVKLYTHHIKRKQLSSLFVLIGFIMIFIGEAVLGAVLIIPTVFEISRFVTVIGYGCIITSQFLVKR